MHRRHSDEFYDFRLAFPFYFGRCNSWISTVSWVQAAASRIRLCVFDLIVTVRGADDPLQLPVIQPVHAAIFTIVEDDVSWSAVWVRVHFLAAFGTADAAVQ